MPTNPHLRFIPDKPQQDLMTSISTEFIRNFGMDVIYIMRQDPESIGTRYGLDDLMGDDRIAVYKKNYLIEMYLASVNDFEGEGDLYRKFGIEISNSAELIVSKFRFTQETGLTHPREGDLIYLPLTNSLFEIKYVDIENSFYQFGKLYTTKLNIELFQYSNEIFETGIPAIDDLVNERGYSVELVLESGGTGAYELNEAVSLSGMTVGYVQNFDPTIPVLFLYHPKGEFEDGDVLVGSSTGAVWIVSTEDLFDMPGTPFSDNEFLEQQGLSILDWDEHPPEGTL